MLIFFVFFIEGGRLPIAGSAECELSRPPIDWESKRSRVQLWWIFCYSVSRSSPLPLSALWTFFSVSFFWVLSLSQVCSQFMAIFITPSSVRRACYVSDLWAASGCCFAAILYIW